MRINLNRAILFAIFIVMGCNSKLEEPDRIAADEILQLKTGKPRLQYAGQDTTTVTARIPREAGSRDVKFTTTDGVFVASGSGTISHYADSLAGDYRYAVVLLTSDSTYTTVYITAETGSARKSTTIIFFK
jgi:hypothetical protein